MDDMIKTLDTWKVLVVDSVGLKLLNSVCNMNDIHDAQVVAVESLSKKSRVPYPTYDALYFIEPSSSNIQLIIDDFSSKPPYASCHVFCTAALSDSLFEKMKRSPLQPFIKSLKELNIDFLVVESLVYNFDRKDSIYTIYNPPSPSSLTKELDQMAKQLSFVLGTLKEYPWIRYYNPPNSKNSALAYSNRSSRPSNVSMCGQLALSLEKELREMSKISDNFHKKSTNRSTLLIIDRSFDVVAPLLHEFTYQALLADVVHFEDGKVKWDGEGSSKGVVTIDEHSRAWNDIRHKHIADAMEFIASGVKNLTSDNAAAQYASGGAKGTGSQMQIAEMQNTIAALPEFQKLKANLSLHTDLCQQCMGVYGDRGLEKVASIEQELATGVNEKGKPSKLGLSSLLSLFDDQTIVKSDKLRITMLYLISQNGISEEDRNKIIGYHGLLLTDSEIQALTNLSMLGVRQSISYDKSRETFNPYAHKTRNPTATRDDKFDNCRYIPSMKSLLLDEIQGNLDVNLFPYVEAPLPPTDDKSDAPSLRNTKASWATRKTAPKAEAIKEIGASGPKIIVFMVGGLTYSEMRSAYEILERYGKEVIIGSSTIISPEDFVTSLKFLHRSSPPTAEIIAQAERQIRRAPPVSTAESPVKSSGGSFDLRAMLRGESRNISKDAPEVRERVRSSPVEPISSASSSREERVRDRARRSPPEDGRRIRSGPGKNSPPRERHDSRSEGKDIPREERSNRTADQRTSSNERVLSYRSEERGTDRSTRSIEERSRATPSGERGTARVDGSLIPQPREHASPQPTGYSSRPGASDLRPRLRQGSSPDMQQGFRGESSLLPHSQSTPALSRQLDEMNIGSSRAVRSERSGMPPITGATSTEMKSSSAPKKRWFGK